MSKKLKFVKRVFLIVSLKGGVGKSTISSSLAYYCAINKRKKTGLWDMDISSASLAKIFRLENEHVDVDAFGITPIHHSENLQIMSTEFLLPETDQPVLLNGEKKAMMIEQFIDSVKFGHLDYLFIDTPPTTSEEILTIMKILEHAQMSIIFVTQPSDVSDNSVQKSIRYLTEEGMRISGIIDNMDGHVCSNCGHKDRIFKQDDLTTKDLAKRYGITYLGGIPTGLMTGGPRGEIVLTDKKFTAIAEKILRTDPIRFKKRFGKTPIWKKLSIATKEIIKR